MSDRPPGPSDPPATSADRLRSDAPSRSRHPFSALTPPDILQALDAVGLRGDGRLLQLNSYENRVYQVMLEDGRAVVAKFYRPGRWTDAQIAEEHALALACAREEIPVIAPLRLAPGGTLTACALEGQAFRLAVFPRVGGQAPELEDPQTLRWLGRYLARCHGVGAREPFRHRRRLDAQTFGRAAIDRVVASELIGAADAQTWRAIAEAALARAEAALTAVPATTLRLHGDCHPGNILWQAGDPAAAGPVAAEADADPEGDPSGWTGPGPRFVDLDDAVQGPAVQDLWMLLSGDRETASGQLRELLAGYRQWRDLDARELALIEPLRTLRMLHHSAWLAERWDDPAFPIAFPWFGTPGYWAQQAQELREQIAAMDEPPLSA